jgi:elongation factor Ts
MSEITDLKQLIVALRERTGAGIMSCKKALVEAEGDIEKAYDAIRAKLGKSAEHKAGRSATEGKIAIRKGPSDVAIVIVKCETDFVSKGDAFQAFADGLVDVAYSNEINQLESLMSQPMGEGDVEAARVALVGRVGENIQVSAVHYLKQEDAFVSVYSHGDKIACAVFTDVENEAVGKDIGMHVVAMNPLAVLPEDVPSDILEREKAIFMTQTLELGKPEFAERIVQGKMAKFLKEVCLLDQSFVKDTTKTINEYLKSSNTRVLTFKRVELS